MRLRVELDRLAQDVQEYPEVERVLAAARRRKVARLAAASGLATVLALAVLVAPAWLADGRPGRPIPLTSGSSAPEVRQVLLPATAAGIPADRPVGIGAFIYASGGKAYLVTTGGDQYAVPHDDVQSGVVSLSPDGRWLFSKGTLRDLSGTAIRQIDAFWFVRAWSPDGRRLLTESGGSQHVVDTATGHHVSVDASALAVLNDGSVLASGDGAGTAVVNPRRAVLQVLDGVTGTLLRQIAIDASGMLSEKSAIAGRLGIIRVVTGPANQVMLQVDGDGTGPRAIVASLVDGRVLGIVRAPAVPSGGSWVALGFAGDSVLFKGTGMAPSGGADAVRTQLAIASLGGETRPLYHLPANVEVVAPGTAISV